MDALVAAIARRHPRPVLIATSDPGNLRRLMQRDADIRRASHRTTANRDDSADEDVHQLVAAGTPVLYRVPRATSPFGGNVECESGQRISYLPATMAAWPALMAAATQPAGQPSARRKLMDLLRGGLARARCVTAA